MLLETCCNFRCVKEWVVPSSEVLLSSTCQDAYTFFFCRMWKKGGDIRGGEGYAGRCHPHACQEMIEMGVKHRRSSPMTGGEGGGRKKRMGNVNAAGSRGGTISQSLLQTSNNCSHWLRADTYKYLNSTINSSRQGFFSFFLSRLQTQLTIPRPCCFCYHGCEEGFSIFLFCWGFCVTLEQTLPYF